MRLIELKYLFKCLFEYPLEYLAECKRWERAKLSLFSFWQEVARAIAEPCAERELSHSTPETKLVLLEWR